MGDSDGDEDGGGVDGDDSGGNSPSRRHAGIEIMSPKLEFRDGGGGPGVFLEFLQLV